MQQSEAGINHDCVLLIKSYYTREQYFCYSEVERTGEKVYQSVHMFSDIAFIVSRETQLRKSEGYYIKGNSMEEDEVHCVVEDEYTQ